MQSPPSIPLPDALARSLIQAAASESSLSFALPELAPAPQGPQEPADAGDPDSPPPPVFAEDASSPTAPSRHGGESSPAAAGQARAAHPTHSSAPSAAGSPTAWADEDAAAGFSAGSGGEDRLSDPASGSSPLPASGQGQLSARLAGLAGPASGGSASVIIYGDVHMPAIQHVQPLLDKTQPALVRGGEVDLIPQAF